MAPLTREWERVPIRYGHGAVSPGEVDALAIHAYRKLAVAFLEWACGYGRDPKQKGLPYDAVIERSRRGWVKGYSSCGDLAHAMYEALGVRLPWVNRDANGGWKMEKNITLLSVGTNACARSLEDPAMLFPGDVVIIANHCEPHPNDDHAVCILDRDDGYQTSSGDVFSTAEYGAVYPVAGGLRKRVVRSVAGGWMMVSPEKNHGRRIQSHVALSRVLISAWDAGLLAPIATEYLRP